MKTEPTKLSQFKNTLGFKMFIIFFIGLMLLIPTGLVQGVISDRIRYQETAKDSIIDPIGGEFSFYGTMIAIPYSYYKSEKTLAHDYILITPKDYSFTGDIKTKMLSRGIFKIPAFDSIIDINLEFAPYKVDPNLQYHNIKWGNALFILATKNRQNFKELPSILINGQTLQLHETAEFVSKEIFANSFSYSLSEKLVRSGFKSEVQMNIQGGNALNLLPVGEKNNITLKGNWEDVGFSGNWLPTHREITKEGFSATWEIAGFNTPLYGVNYLDEIQNMHDYNPRNKNDNAWNKTISTSLLLLNDNYARSSRSVKYAMLFIFIPFFALFLCELLTRKNIHVIQYVLIGLANILFYLLLLSISEHIGFNASYIISAIIVTVTTALYVWGITKSHLLGGILAGVEAIIYGFLFGIMQLTDYALIVGTFGLFLAIVIAMYFTRNIAEPKT